MSPRREEPDLWPWPGDSPLDRARRVARTYRDALAAARPEACRQLDAQLADLGQSWIIPQVVVYNQDDLLTIELVAAMCDVKNGTVAQWRRRGLRVMNTPDGPRYRVADVLEYHARLRRRRARVDQSG